MNQTYFKGYWMATNRCNLSCSYCVLENKPEQLRRELSHADKLGLVDHLYGVLRFRRLTLSGGEITILGERPPEGFLSLLSHLAKYRSPDPTKNLEVEMYTNGARLDARVADAMQGVIDQVAVTIDSDNPDILSRIGRSRPRQDDYYLRALGTCALLASRGIDVKLHSVVSSLNVDNLVPRIGRILEDIRARGGRVSAWKFYQYMSYDDPLRDMAHRVGEETFRHFSRGAAVALAGSGVEARFKDNAEMDGSLFNILPYGNAQYLAKGDTWSTSHRTRDLRTYASMDSLLDEHAIDRDRFLRFHGISR